MSNTNRYRREGLIEKFFRHMLIAYYKLRKDPIGTTYVPAGECPICGKDVLHLDGQYSCLGLLNEKCTFKTKDTSSGRLVEYKEIYLHFKQQKARENGFFDNLVIKTNNEEKIDDKNSSNNNGSSLVTCSKCSSSVSIKEDKYVCNKCGFTINKNTKKTKINIEKQVDTSCFDEEDDFDEQTNHNKDCYSNEKDTIDDSCNNEYYYGRGNCYSQEPSFDNESNYDYQYEDEYYDSQYDSNHNNCSTHIHSHIGECPQCRNSVIIGKTAYGCMGFKDSSCNLKIPFKYNNYKISVYDAQKLINNKTISINSSNNEEIYLKLNNGKLEVVPF